jgi:hypothetical protein
MLVMFLNQKKRNETSQKRINHPLTYIKVQVEIQNYF